MKNCIAAEFLKLRHSKIIWVLLILPILSILLGSGNFWMNQEVLQEEWLSLWTQVNLFYTYLFFPVLISIVCAYLCRLEHQSRSWNTLLSAPVPVRNLYLSKWTVAVVISILIQVFMMGLYFAAGVLFQFESTPPPQLLGWFFRGLVAAAVIATFQLFLSLMIRSFAAPVGVCMCLSIGGVVLLSQGLGVYFVPHALMALGMGAASQVGLTLGDTIVFWVMAAVFFAIFSALSVRLLKRRDV